MSTSAAAMPEGPGDADIAKLIYLEFSDIFSGDKAFFRKTKTIKKHLDQDAYKGRLESFCDREKLPQTLVEDTIRLLLKDQVFANLTIAKIKFPHLFQLSAEQLKEKENRESEAAQSEAGFIAASVQEEVFDELGASETEVEIGDTPKKPAKARKKRKKTIKSLGDPIVIESSGPDAEDSDIPDAPLFKKQKNKEDNKQIEILQKGRPSIAEVVQSKLPNLFPIYLPFPAQHKFMTRSQEILEIACHEFVVKWQNLYNDPNKDDEPPKYPHSTELQKWVRYIRKMKPRLPETAYDMNALEPYSITQVTETLAKLRHTAVHRLKTHSKGIEKLLETAVRFAKFLKNEETTLELQKMLDDSQILSAALEHGKIMQLKKLEKQLEAIETKRRELDDLELELRLDVSTNDRGAPDNLNWEDILGYNAPDIKVSKDGNDSEAEELANGNGKSPRNLEDSEPQAKYALEGVPPLVLSPFDFLPALGSPVPMNVDAILKAGEDDDDMENLFN